MTNEQLALLLDTLAEGLQLAREQIQNGLPHECLVESPPLIPALCPDPVITYPILDPLDQQIRRLRDFGDELKRKP